MPDEPHTNQSSQQSTENVRESLRQENLRQMQQNQEQEARRINVRENDDFERGKKSTDLSDLGADE